MFKPVLKYTFIAFIWKRYKGAILSALLLLLFIFLVIVIHNDYVRYSEATGQQSRLALSFLLKWSMIIGALFAYLFYIKVLLRVKPKAKPPKSSVSSSADDAFSDIRSKDKLRSKADTIIETDQDK